AAHVSSNIGGQGMNTGMQDAHNLGWKLGLVLNSRSPASLLDSYHPERHQAGRDMLYLTDHLHRVALREEPHLSLSETLRQKLATVLAGQEVMQRMRRAVAELNIGYGHRPIVAGTTACCQDLAGRTPLFLGGMISAPDHAREIVLPMPDSCFVPDVKPFGCSRGYVGPHTIWCCSQVL